MEAAGIDVPHYQKYGKVDSTLLAAAKLGRVLSPEAFTDSALYDANHVHVLRPRRKG